jgi:hypothetical protein
LLVQVPDSQVEKLKKEVKGVEMYSLEVNLTALEDEEVLVQD